MEALLGISAAIAAIALLLLGAGLVQRRRLRLLQSLPTVASTGPQGGFVQVEGRASSSQPFQAAFSESPAVYCSYRIEKLRNRTTGPFSSDSNHRRWKSIHHSSSDASSFSLAVEEAELMVHPKGLRHLSDATWSLVCRDVEQYPRHILEFLGRHWISPKSLFIFPRTLRFHEYRVAPNDHVYMIGWFRNAAEGSRSILERRRRLFGGPFLIFRGTAAEAADYFGGRMQLGLVFGTLLLLVAAGLAGAAFLQ